MNSREEKEAEVSTPHVPRSPSPEFDFPSLPPSPPPDKEVHHHSTGTLSRSKSEKLNKSVNETQKTPPVRLRSQSNLTSQSTNQTFSNRSKPDQCPNISNDNLDSVRKTPESQRKGSNLKSSASIRLNSEHPPRKVLTHGGEVLQNFTVSERKSRRQLEEEAWIPHNERTQTTDNYRRESRSRSRKIDDEICEKCHHKKGRRRSKSSDQHLKSKAESSLPLYDRDREEMEILKRYIRKENPHMEYMCNCAKTTLDFNRHFSHDYKNFQTKKKSKGSQSHNKFDF